MKETTRMTLPSDADASGRSFGAEELDELRRVVESGVLNCTKGTAVRTFEKRFAETLGIPFCRTTTSGTAAIHAAVAAIDPEPGDEIVTTPITDMGGITPIVYQAAIPVFADVDPRTFNVTAETIAPRITRRTKAVIVTHLFGLPCDMGPILELCAGHGIPVIEDCAQAFTASWQDRPVGTIGTIGAFSLQQGKHMTTGEGGMVVTADPGFERRMRLFIDKAWGYGDPKPDHYFLALNYRMTELQGAVALAQLEKLEAMAAQRIRMARLMDEMIGGLPGVLPPAARPGSRHVYWKYPLTVDGSVIAGGVDAFAAKLKEAGIFSAPRYIQKPAFECQVIRDRVTFGKSGFPWVGEHRRGEPEIVYRPEDFPGTYEALSTIVVLPWNEKYTERHVEFIAREVRRVAEELAAVGGAR